MITIRDFLQTAMDLIQFLLLIWLFFMINKNENRIDENNKRILELDLYKEDIDLKKVSE